MKSAKKRQSLLFLSLCLLAFPKNIIGAEAVYRNKKPLPAHLERAGRSVWKLRAEGEREIYGGSGFFIRPLFEEESEPGNTGENDNISSYMVTNFHIAHRMLQHGASPETIVAAPPTPGKTLTVDRLSAVDGTADLALLKMKGTAPAPLRVRESPPDIEEDLFAFGWPGGVFRAMKKTGLLTAGQNDQYFPVDFSDLEGGSGGPVVDREGRVVGVSYSAVENFLFSVKSDFLKGFLRGERGIRCGNTTSMDCLKRAETALLKAAEETDSPALFILSRLYSRGGILFEKNTEKTFELMKLSAEKGNPSAQRDVAQYCRRGVGVDKSIPCAVAYAEQSAKQGFAPGQYVLAELYAAHEELKKKDQNVFELILSAAEKGFSPAQNAAALAYFSGVGVEGDFPLAVSWIKKAAEQGFAPAKHLLGHLHYQGFEVEKDIPLALRLWTEAALQHGNEDARFSLALLLYTGEAEEEGGPGQNIPLALRQIHLLAERGHSPAKEFLKKHQTP